MAGLVALVAATVWGTKLGVQFSITFLALKALPVLIIGGFTSVPGAIVGGLIVGAGEKLAEVYLGPHIGGGIEYWFAYVLALVVLLVRPQGLFGERIIERNLRDRESCRNPTPLHIPERCSIAKPASSRRATPPTWRSFRSARTASRSSLLLAFAFIGVPLLAQFHVWPLGSDYLLRAILIPFLILALAAIGLNILIGYCGQISLGSGAFMAIGAYSAYKFGTGVHLPLAWLGTEISIPPLPVLRRSCSAADVGRRRHPVRHPEPAHQGPLSRGRDAGRAVLLRLGVHPREVVHQLHAVRLGDRARAQLLRLRRSTRRSSATCSASSFVTVFALIAKNLVRGNIGRQWMAIRDMDIAAELMGIRPLYAKLTAFAVSSFIVGVAGALWAFVYLGAWEPLAFDIDRSFQLLFMVIIGGLGSILGSFLGAAFILMLPILLDQVPHALGIPRHGRDGHRIWCSSSSAR